MKLNCIPAWGVSSRSLSFTRPALIAALLMVWVWSVWGRGDPGYLDDTGGFVHLAPSTVHTTNGCDYFQVAIVATLTDARVFTLRFYFDQTALELLAVTPGPDSRLRLLPEQLLGNQLTIDGFFHPNFPAGTVTLTTLDVRAIAPNDFTTRIGFTGGNGYSGTSDAPEPIIFNGDTCSVLIEGTLPLAPDSLIIQRMPYPAHDDSVCLRWRPVRRDLDGDPVLNPLYTVYFRDVVHGMDWEIGTTPDTFFYNGYIDSMVYYVYYDSLGIAVDSAARGLYYVKACKTQP